jgi:hypothetical protein
VPGDLTVSPTKRTLQESLRLVRSG